MGDGHNSNGASKTRNRCPNFTEPETERLIRLVEANSTIILDKRTDKSMLMEKDRVWDGITAEFNKHLERHKTPRTPTQLRAKLANMRKRLQDSLNQSEAASDAGDPFEDQSSSTDGTVPVETKLEFMPIAQRPALPAHKTEPLMNGNGAVFASDEMSERLEHAYELQRQELRHREELHTLKVTQMQALHELRMKEAELRVKMMRRKLGYEISESEGERSDTED